MPFAHCSSSANSAPAADRHMVDVLAKCIGNLGLVGKPAIDVFVAAKRRCISTRLPINLHMAPVASSWGAPKSACCLARETWRCLCSIQQKSMRQLWSLRLQILDR